MPSSFFRPAGLLIAILSLPHLAFAQSQGTLTLTNGDRIPGFLIATDTDAVTWKTPISKTPTHFKQSVVSSISFDIADTSTPAEDLWRVEMLNKDVLFGALTGVSNETLSFHSKQFGDFVLNRSQVHDLHRMNRDETIYNGPQGSKGWLVAESASALGNVFKEHELHQLTTKLPGGLFHPLDLPEKFKVEFILASADIPRFVLCFDGDDSTRGQMQLEVWKDTLVALANYDFVEVTTFTPDQHQVHLIAYVDRTARQLKMYTGSGKHLADLKVPEGATLFTKPGLFIENLKGDLTIQKVRVERWNGEIDSAQSAVVEASHIPSTHRLDEMKSPDTLIFEANGSVIEKPVTQIASIAINDKLPQLDTTSGSLIAWGNGGILRGELLSIKDQIASVRTTYSSAPFKCQMQGIDRLLFDSKTTLPDETVDEAIFSNGNLSGELTFSPGLEPLRWKAFGSEEATPIALDAMAKLERSGADESSSIDVNSYPDILFLNDNNVLPAKITSVDESTVKFESPFSAVTKLPADDIRAIEFSAVRDPRLAANIQWKTSVGEAQISDDRIVFNTNATVQHPALLNGDELQFHLKWPETYITLSCELFEADLASSEEGQTKIFFTLHNRSLTVLSKAQYEAQMHGHVIRDPSAPRNYIRVKENQANVRLVLDDGHLHVIVAGKTLSTIPLNKLGFQGHGINLSVDYPHRPKQPVSPSDNQPPQELPKEELIVSDFEVKQTKGALVKQFIQKQSRERTLIIPRFRRDNPPKHVAIAHNGDLLRGDLQVMSGNNLQFASKLETLKLPKETVAAVVWLRLPPEGQSDVEPVSQFLPSSARLTTTDGYSLVMVPTSFSEGSIHGTSPRLGECSIPVNRIKSITIGNPERAIRGEYVAWIPSRSPEPRFDMPEDEEETLPAEQLIGRKMDDFELDTYGGSKFKLSDHADKVVVLDFWASWCGPCVKAMPGYIDAVSKFDPEKVVFVAVNLREEEQKVREFLDVQQYPKPPTIAFDSNGNIATAFRVSGIPHTVVIAPGNILKEIHIGFAEENGQKITEEIEGLLKTSAN